MGTVVAGAGLLLSGLALAVPASAADRTTSDVSEATWQEVWAEVGHPNTADKWRCYGTPRQLNRDPSWVIVFYRNKQTPECAGLPGDPYPVLAHKSGGEWSDSSILGPMSCDFVSGEVLGDGGSWGIVKDLMKDEWCLPIAMWRGYMERFLNTRACAKPLTPRPNKYVVGYIGRSEVAGKIDDGAVAWTCARAAGGAQDQYLTVFLAGPVPKQVTVSLNMMQFESLKIRHNRLVVTGGQYSGSGPLCCPDLRVTATYQMRDGKLVKLKETVKPL